MNAIFPTKKMLLLSLPNHDGSLLPVPRAHSGGRLLAAGRAAWTAALSSALERRRNIQVVAEFRSKMKTAEDLISKLAFSLREIQTAPRRRRKKKTESPNGAKILAVPNKN